MSQRFVLHPESPQVRLLRQAAQMLRDGGVVALPLLIMFKVICDHTPPLRVIGALIGAPLVRDTRIKDEIAAQTIPHRKLGSHEPEATEGDAIKAQVAVV